MPEGDLTAADPMCPVCECAIVDDLAHIDHCHLGEVAAHGECLPTDVMLDAIRSERREAAGWQRLTQQWRDIACDRRNELYIMYAVLEPALARITELEAGAQLMGAALAEYNAIALEATGTVPDMERGDGTTGYVDWQGVWEQVAELRPQLDAANKHIAELEQQAAVITEAVEAFINEIPEHGGDPDLWEPGFGEWVDGGVDARVALALRLGWTVPRSPGDKTTPKSRTDAPEVTDHA